MFPPGRVIFVRPLKVLSGKHGPGRKLEKRWDCVWVTPEQLMSEGILISKKARPRRKPAPPPPASHPVARCGARAAACGVACPAGSAARMPCCLRASRSCLRGAARAAGAAARRCWRTT